MENLVAAAIYSGVFPTTLKLAGKDRADVYTIAAALSVAAAFSLIWKRRRPIPRAVLTPPKTTGDRFAIHVVRFKRDKQSRILQQRISKTIRKGFGETVEVLWATLPPAPPNIFFPGKFVSDRTKNECGPDCS